MDQLKEKTQALLERVLFRTDWKQLGGGMLQDCAGIVCDAAMWLAALAVLGMVNIAVGLIPLAAVQREMLAGIHLNALYAIVLVASASVISRLVVSALERLSHWERGL